MSKRASGAQLTRFPHEQEGGPTDAEPDTPQMASAEVMATRKIAAGRGFKKSAPAKANPFAVFGSQMINKPSPAVASSGASTAAKKAGLNKKFAQTIAGYLESNPSGDWTAACEKYITYYRGLGDSPATHAAAPAAAPTATSAAAKPGLGSVPENAPFKAFEAPKTDPKEDNKPVEYKAPTNYTFGHAAKAPSQGKIDFKPPAAFSFGGKSSEPSEPKEPSKPVEQPKPVEEKPKFSFGNTSAPFSFGAKPAEKKEGAAPAPSFGTPNLNFGGEKAPAAFKFGASTPAAAPAASTPAPAFTFGKPAEAPASAPAAGTPAPAFSFGATSTPAFSFGQPAASKPLSETANSSGFGGSWQPSVKKDEPAVAEDEDEQQDEQQGDLAVKGAGEENEDSVYEVKSKLYSASNDVVGLGMLRILVHRETKKARVVMRAEGSGRVLLNAAIQKPVNYTSTKQFATIPYFGGDKPTSYKARVKTEQDAQALAAKFNEVKA